MLAPLMPSGRALVAQTLTPLAGFALAEFAVLAKFLPQPFIARRLCPCDRSQRAQAQYPGQENTSDKPFHVILRSKRAISSPPLAIGNPCSQAKFRGNIFHQAGNLEGCGLQA
jgi:hypothetical protein